MRTNPQAPTERRQDSPAPSGGPLAELAQSARSPWALGVGGVTIVLVFVAVVAGPALRFFLDFGAGVLALVSLSCAVIWGLVITQDHLFLGPRERLITQGIHRVLGVSSVSFLVLHVATKVAEAHWPLIGAFLPLGVTHQDGLISLGLLAGYLMILAAVTGAVRSKFAAKRHPVRWRLLHASSYLAWCAALVHGLLAGRAAKPFFVYSYVICVIGVGIGLILRLRSLRGESLFGERRGTAAATMDAINDARGGVQDRARRRPVGSGASVGGLQPAYGEPLPPMKLRTPNEAQAPAPAVAAAQQSYPQVGYDTASTGQIPMVQAANTGQYPTVQAGGTGQFPTVQAGGTGQFPTVQAANTGQIPTVQTANTGQYPTVQTGGTGQFPTVQQANTGQFQTVQPQQPQQQAQQQPYAYQQAPAAQQPAANGQAGWDGTPAWGTPTAQDMTPPWGMAMPQGQQPPAADGSGDATRLQPVSWQQATPRPYDRPYEGQR